ncbi:MAG: Heavy metal RND efflux outer membrane protein, CzcC family [uncultured Sulfurovum sp.]|uniref:Heavy metal RND efflux outer membrane protein, CzcC family n=1 Tax=uncultured Sulfurovum sp. TaxID=269237 RepID=A0A6S6T9B7_9BACT|nr:MAG: Heavy metal RND efflux outer membrane protein, CzcC family [uncultured Sulfurovum sp.]
MIFLTLSLSLFGMSYAKFKKHIEENSKVLKSQQLSLEANRQENNILLRTQNPTLNLEAARYNPDFTDSEYGYEISASQTIRTGNYLEGLQDKANASNLLQQAYVLEGKAGYMKALEGLYTEYVYQSKLLSLLKQEYELSSEVTGIVEERYKSGSENKASYLQAKTDTLALKTLIYTTKQQMNSLHYELLAIAGFSKKKSLDKKFIYSVSSQTKSVSKVSPQEKILVAKEKMLAGQMRMNESSFNSYELSTGIEQEPEQSIIRFGISIPLTVQHNKEEEKALARLKMQQLELDSAQLKIDLSLKKQMLKDSIKELSQQYHSLKTLKTEQEALSALLLEGYKIAQGSIFVMMNAKNKLIQTQKSLLQTQAVINNKKIELRFIQGQYND